MARRRVVDIGANLTSGQFRRDLHQVLRRAKQAGVDSIIITGTSVDESRSALQQAKHHAASSGVALFTTVGVHPHDAKSFDEHSTIAEIRSIITSEGRDLVVAVGECGLDFNRDYSPRDAQVKAFRAQVALACELKMPLFVHEREAHEALVEVLQPFVESGVLPPTVVHCFTGDENEMMKYLEMGFYIGLTGFVCMEPRGLVVKEMVPRIPLDRLMIETDAPYMYPYNVGRQKKRARCEPKDIAAVVRTLASCYGISEDEVAKATTENARRFFRLREQVNDEKTASPVEMQTENQEIEGSVVLNGGNGEGGGQLLRVATALAAVTQRIVRVHSIRANRKAPGLRNQHLSTIELVAALSAGGKLSGARLNSTDLTFDARSALLTGAKGGAFSAASRTGGSISLMLQGAFPVLTFRDSSTELSLRGGTHVGFSPTIDFMQVPLRSLLARFGLNYNLEVSKRMFFPGGGPSGQVQVSVNPVDTEKTLQSIDFTESSTSIRHVFIRVTACGSSANEKMAEHYASALKLAITQTFTRLSEDLELEVECIVETTAATNQKKKASKVLKAKEKTAVSSLVVLETATNGIISLDRTVNVNESTASILADQMSSKLSEYVQSGTCVDEHLADNAVVFMALAQGTSRLRVPCKAQRTSQHLETALEIASRLTGAAYRLLEEETSAIIEVDEGPEELAVSSRRKSDALASRASRVSLQWSVPSLEGKPPSARGGHSAVLAGTHLLIFGGHYFGSAGGFVYLNDLHRLDLGTSSWAEVVFPKEQPRREQVDEGEADAVVLPAPRYGHSAILLNDNERMFVFGGRGAQGEAFRDMFFFDLNAMAWQQVQWTTDCPAGRYGHAVASVDDEKMFVFGGWDGKKSMNDLWVFDSTTFTWRRPKCAGKPPTARQNLSMVGLSNNEDSPPSLLLYGGYTVIPDTLPVYNKDVYVFDVAAMAWSRPRLVGEYPPGTFGQSLNLAGAGSGAELAVMLGGWSGTERTPLYMGDKQLRELVRQESREQRLVSSNNQREQKRKKRERKKQHERDLRTTSSYARVLDVQNMEWHRVTAYGVAVANRYGHTSTLVGPHLFLFGGWDGNRALNQLVVGELSIAPEPEPTEDFSIH
ncbi:RNA 3'-phosphate cyclase [Phytophthora nicotianae]|uniref:RNA 3'-phosphate cyclase n=1 Tax=Phytophthora nicotianae TaxID=4792 RepID=W2L5U3_PHYNI|nr:RNA 3'-phosphate cyclase [Phytophthora nicotianae]